MDPRRKKVYIILIVVCLVLSAGILVWSTLSSPDQSSLLPEHSGGTSGLGSSSSSGSTGVFPSTNNFNTEVLDSEAFKKLKEYSAVDPTGQIGRPDPFKSY